MFNLENTKYEVHYTNLFKKQYKKVTKQGKDIKKFLCILEVLANGLLLLTGCLYINIMIKD